MKRTLIWATTGVALLLAAIVVLYVGDGRSDQAARTTVAGTRLLVDGKPFFVKAVSYGVSFPGKESYEEIAQEVFEQDFKAIREAGFNTIRTYEPLPDELIDLAELNDLFVIEGILHIDDGTDLQSQESLERLKAKAISTVRRHRGKSNILFWCLWNDAPFQWGSQGGNVVTRYGFDEVESFLKELYTAVKAVDPDRLVAAANVLNAPGYELGFDFVDVIGVNVYIGISDWATGSFDRSLGELTVDRLEGIAEKYRKPVFVSEMGHSTFGSVSTQGRVIPAQIELMGDHLAGFCLFQWHDDWSKAGDVFTQAQHIETHWGLVDAYRVPKSDFQAVAGAVTAAPAYVVSTDLAQRGELPAQVLDEGRVELVEDFSYSHPQVLLSAYGVRQHGASRVEASLEDSRLVLAFTPEDFGAWLYFGRTFENPRDWSEFQELRLSLQSEGPMVNFSAFLISEDGRIIRGEPLLARGGKAEVSLRLDPAFLFRDLSLESQGLGYVSDSPDDVSLHEIRGFGFKINDVPNFEQVGQTTTLRLSNLRLTR